MRELREAMAAETTDTRLANAVEIDGAYFGGHARPANIRAPQRLNDLEDHGVA